MELEVQALQFQLKEAAKLQEETELRLEEERRKAEEIEFQMAEESILSGDLEV